MLTTNLKLGLAVAALLAAVIVLVADPSIIQGSGLIVATLAAGAGWLVRDTHDEARRRRSICQAYAAVIEAQLEEINDALSDEELERFLHLSPAIVAGTEPESLGFRAPDPFALLPEIRDHMHLLSPLSTRLLWKWRVRASDLFFVYDMLGTKQLSAMGPDRLKAYFDWVRRYRDEYRVIAHDALRSLSQEVPDLRLGGSHGGGRPREEVQSGPEAG